MPDHLHTRPRKWPQYLNAPNQHVRTSESSAHLPAPIVRTVYYHPRSAIYHHLVPLFSQNCSSSVGSIFPASTSRLLCSSTARHGVTSPLTRLATVVRIFTSHPHVPAQCLDRSQNDQNTSSTEFSQAIANILGSYQRSLGTISLSGPRRTKGSKPLRRPERNCRPSSG